MLLTAFGLLSFTGLLKVIGDVEADNTWAAKALFCAQEQMEELEFARLTGNNFTSEGKEVVTEGPYQGMQREWTTASSSILDGLLELHVDCAYPWKGDMKGVELSTLVFPED
jgi:hypothetical protein